MSEIDSLFSKRHEHLREKYRDKTDPKYASSCTQVALELADLLRRLGSDPNILIVRGKVIDNRGNRATLVPKPYNGKLLWGAHVICEANGLVYDPMLPEPVERVNYAAQAFTEPVVFEGASYILDSPYFQTDLV